TWSRPEPTSGTVAAGWAAAVRAAAPGPERSGSTCTGRGGADNHTAVGVDADGLGLHARRVLHRKVHDATLIREHRLERDGLAGRANARGDASCYLAELFLAAPAVTLDVDGDVHRTPDPTRGHRGGDLLQRDEVLAAAPDERAEVRGEHVDPFGVRTIVDLHIGFDAHQLEELGEHANARGEVLRGDGRCFLQIGRAPGREGGGAAGERVGLVS